MDYSERESILKEARESNNDDIRSAAWIRVKAELDIMVKTFENSDQDDHGEKFREIADIFITNTERGCFNE
jgi:hypothetical protein